MRTQADIAARINEVRKAQERSWAWLSRESEIEYKQLLRQAKNCTARLTVENAALIASALGVDLADLMPARVSGPVAP
jgi:hypothetical protein